MADGKVLQVVKMTSSDKYFSDLVWRGQLRGADNSSSHDGGVLSSVPTNFIS